MTLALLLALALTATALTAYLVAATTSPTTVLTELRVATLRLSARIIDRPSLDWLAHLVPANTRERHRAESEHAARWLDSWDTDEESQREQPLTYARAMWVTSLPWV